MSGSLAPGALVHGDGHDVFLVRHSGARVALKLLRDDVPSERLRRERAALRDLRHRNIVRLHSFGMTRGHPPMPYLATELLKGASLRVVLNQERRLGVDRALDYGADLFAALAAAQEIQIAHRDLRPENAFIDRAQPTIHRLVVHDFGLVCPAHGRLPTAQGIIGDPRYAAPEVLYGGPPSFRSDLYAAGVMLFEMVTGDHPLGRPSGDWRTTHGSVEPTALDAIEPYAPAELVALVASLLAKDARQRPRSAAECVDIFRALRSTPVANANTTLEDGVDSFLRQIAGPAPAESTQVDPPTPSLLARASGADDTAPCAPPAPSSSWRLPS
jgi:serine/threonine protein kinase